MNVYTCDDWSGLPEEIVGTWLQEWFPEDSLICTRVFLNSRNGEMWQFVDAQDGCDEDLFEHCIEVCRIDCPADFADWEDPWIAIGDIEDEIDSALLDLGF